MTVPLLRMRPRDVVEQALAALRTHRLRSILSMVGIVFSIATVVTALAIGEGAKRTALAEIGALGIDNIYIRAIAEPVLTLDDAAAIAETLDTEIAVSASRVARVTVRAGERQTESALTGMTPTWREVAQPAIASGRWLSASDERRQRRVAIIGHELARVLFSSADPLGHQVLAGDTWFTIVGRLQARTLGGGARPAIESLDVDRSLLVPLSAMDVRIGKGDGPGHVGEIGVRLTEAGEIARTARALSEMMKRRHRDQAGYDLVVPQELLRARLRAQRAFNAVLIGIGLLALVISGIGIMNIMLASVAERRHEIGIRRAFGARRPEIIAQFAIEATLLCIAGAAVGIPLGALFSVGVALAAGWPVAVSLKGILFALTLATGVGLASGVYPARLAAEVDPIEALRSV